MASKPKNYKRRVIDSRGAHFRIDSGNPTEGLAGAEVYKVFAESDDGDCFIIAHTQGGLSRIAADKTLEVRLVIRTNLMLLTLELVLLMVTLLSMLTVVELESKLRTSCSMQSKILT